MQTGPLGQMASSRILSTPHLHQQDDHSPNDAHEFPHQPEVILRGHIGLLKELLLHQSVVPGVGAVSDPGLERAVDTAHGKADDVQHIDGTQHAEVGPPIPLPLEAHQFLYRCLVQDLASLPQKE